LPGQSVNDGEIIKKNLIAQLTSPVRWTKIMQNMIADGANNITEVGPGKVLQGLFKKVERQIQTQSAEI
jgi:[acyl-carrier-protein] S-malonyltransferase